MLCKKHNHENILQGVVYQKAKKTVRMYVCACVRARTCMCVCVCVCMNVDV